MWPRLTCACSEGSAQCSTCTCHREGTLDYNPDPPVLLRGMYLRYAQQGRGGVGGVAKTALKKNVGGEMPRHGIAGEN